MKLKAAHNHWVEISGMEGQISEPKKRSLRMGGVFHPLKAPSSSLETPVEMDRVA